MTTNKTKNNRKNLNPETLQDLQESLYDWQNYNFGKSQDNELVLLGICEEAGELCRAQLKFEQGIRGITEADLKDAIADISIYTLNYLSGLGEKLPTFVDREDVEATNDPKIVRQAVFSIYRKAGRLVEEPTSMARIGHLITDLIYLCAIKGWRLEQVIRDAWVNEVGPRDWKMYPETGRPPENAAPEPAVVA